MGHLALGMYLRISARRANQCDRVPHHFLHGPLHRLLNRRNPLPLRRRRTLVILIRRLPLPAVVMRPAIGNGELIALQGHGARICPKRQKVKGFVSPLPLSLLRPAQVLFLSRPEPCSNPHRGPSASTAWPTESA